MRQVRYIFCSLFLLAGEAQAQLFDVETRRAQLQKPAYTAAREYCLAKNEKFDGKLPEPISALYPTEGYGSDNRPEAFTWYVMILGGRALVGDATAEVELRKGLLTWAKAGALTQSDVSHDTYYALKRYMLPVIVSYGIVAKGMPATDHKLINQWIDKLVRPLDKKFHGDVDRNNHRSLADAVLMAWGAFTEDESLYRKGIKGYARMLGEARADGGLPLETRRGARALWYQRHAITNMVVMAEIARAQGDDLYGETVSRNEFLTEQGETRSGGGLGVRPPSHAKEISLGTLVNFLLNAYYAPITILPDAAQNYIPGPNANYLQQDLDFLKRRGHGRHYMAFAEAYIRQPGFASQRLRLLMERTGFAERPLIDEYLGGNATCFFWQPEGKKK